MGRDACTEPQCLYKGALYFYLYLKEPQRYVKGTRTLSILYVKCTRTLSIRYAKGTRTLSILYVKGTRTLSILSIIIHLLLQY